MLKTGNSVTLKVACKKSLLIESRKHLALLCIFPLNEDPFFLQTRIFLQTNFLQTWECDPSAGFVYCPPSAFAKVFFTPHENLVRAFSS